MDYSSDIDLSDLIQSVDIVEFISQFVELEERGDEWWGLSCFKDENTPSFSVRKDPPFFYDYSSGLSGNLFHFVRHYFKCSPSRAVEIIKEYAGVDGDISFSPRQKLSAVMVCKKYAEKNSRKEGSMSVLPDDYMDRYEVRPDKLAVWTQEGISKESLRRFQVSYDSFSDRLVYPIRNAEGGIVNIGGRTLDPLWKEKGLRKYTYFRQWCGGMQVVYGLYDNMEFIKNKQEIIIFEGAKSVMFADTYGYKNTGAILTSHLNPQQMKILMRLGCDVVFALDKDVALCNDRNIQKLRHYLNVFYILDRKGLLGEKDSPVDKGKEVFEQLLRERRRL